MEACCVLSLRRGLLSLFKTWLKFRFLAHHRGQKSIEKFKEGNFKKQKQKRTPPPSLLVFCIFLASLPSFFVQRLNKDKRD